MRQSMATLVLIAALTVAVSAPVFARGHSGGGRSHAGRAPSGARATPHAAPHAGPSRSAGIARASVFASVPLYMPWFDPGPGYYYSPPPASYSPPPGSPPVAYIEQAPSPAYWYFCPQLNSYYPYVLECPEAWQEVLPQTPE
jgi:hypothetical protein